jgi:hypothetical protein
MMRKILGVALALSLSGCGVVDEFNQGTDNASVTKFEVKDVDTFRIVDHPEEARMAISMSPSSMASAALNDIFTFGISYPDSPEWVMKSAAVEYLQSTKRNCSVDAGKELARMKWEFRYQCRAEQAKASK